MPSVTDPLTPTERDTAHATLRGFGLWSRSEAHILAEVEERINDAARYECQLGTRDYVDDEEAARLRGGIDYELHMIAALRAELDRRERAKRFGYRPDDGPGESDLPTRFARMRSGGADEFADLIGEATNQPGAKHGGRWRFRCPFHGGGTERTASLTVYPDGYAHCFACGWHGDGAAFVAELRGIGPVEALRLLEMGAA
jgi:hypothetical protein